jgi:hypothetical protein
MEADLRIVVTELCHVRLPSTISEVSLSHSTVMRGFAETQAKIRRESDYWDAATFMKQVGVLPSQ